MMSLKKIILMALLSLILCNFVSINAHADNIGEYNEEDYLPRYYLNDIFGFNISKLNDLPSKVDLSESGYFPMILTQEGDSCASWTTTYYQFTYEVNKKLQNNLNVLQYSQFIKDTELINNMFEEHCKFYDSSDEEIV